MLGSLFAEAISETVDSFFSLGTGTKLLITVACVGIFFIGTGSFMSGVSSLIIASKTKEIHVDQTERDEGEEEHQQIE